MTGISRRRLRLAFALAIAGVALAVPAAPTSDPRGGQFIGFSRVSNFEKSKGDKPGEIVLTSPVIMTRIRWNELVPSWNAQTPESTYLKIEARALYLTRATKFYTLGLWSSNPAIFPRESVPGQKDEDGDVSTDTLKLLRGADRLQIRLTLGGDGRLKPALKFVGLSLTDTKAEPEPLPPNRAAWGKLIPVPERTQMLYPNGKVLCSPTTVSMLIAWWAQQLRRPELDHDVPEIVDAIYDAKWKGTGNWPFNMAYVGSFRGMRAYVARVSDLSEVEDWVAAGMPVGLSLCYDRLRAKGPGPNGHLVVCVGFTEEGDPILNDPGTRENVRKVFKRKNLVNAMAYSRSTVYLVYPEGSEIPADRFGHWDSWSAHLRVRFE